MSALGGYLITHLLAANAEITALRVRAEAAEARADIGACEGCGSTATIEQIRARNPTALSCCPERKMLTAAQWRERADSAEAQAVDQDKLIEKLLAESAQFGEQRDAAEARAVEAERAIAEAREFIVRVADSYHRARNAPYVLDGFVKEARKLLVNFPAPQKGPSEKATAEIKRLRAALEWYGEQARLCRLIHSEGDAGRHALSDDGGKRARAALETGK